MLDKNDSKNLFYMIEDHFSESADDKWKCFALELIHRSSPEVVATAFAAAEMARLPRLPDILVAALKELKQ